MGLDLEHMLSHPSLHPAYKIESNPLAMEFAACAMFGIDPYVEFQRPREWRAAITGYRIGQNMVDAIRADETKPKDKKRK